MKFLISRASISRFDDKSPFEGAYIVGKEEYNTIWGIDCDLFELVRECDHPIIISKTDGIEDYEFSLEIYDDYIE